MLVPLRDRQQLRAIQRDIELQFASLPLFRAGRRDIVEGYSRHAAAICTALGAMGWLDTSSPDLSRASTVIERLASTFRAILRTAATTPTGTGEAAVESVRKAAELGVRFVIVTRVLQHMLSSGAWGLALYDEDSRELVLAPRDDEVQAREAFNSERLRSAGERSLREDLKRGLSADASADDLHLNDAERLNPAYTQRTFWAVMRALHERALALARSSTLCAVSETDRADIEMDLVDRSGVAPCDVSTVIGDLIFSFDPKQDGEQFLIEVSPGRVALIPLLVVERSLFASEYARISKARYPESYGAHHRALTRALEDQVAAALRAHAPHAEVGPLKLPSVLAGVEAGQIDHVAADPAEDGLLIVEVKYTFGHDNELIAEGVSQLQRDERVMRERWVDVSKRLKGWKGRSFPTNVGKLLVTKWFLGTEPTPHDIRILSLDDLRAIPSNGSLRALIERIAASPEPRLVPEHEHRIALFGYTFIHYLTRRGA